MTRGSVDTRTPAERSVLEVARPGPEVMCWFTPPPSPIRPTAQYPKLQQVHSEKKKFFADIIFLFVYLFVSSMLEPKAMTLLEDGPVMTF